MQNDMPLGQTEPEICQIKVFYLGLAAVKASIPTLLYTLVFWKVFSCLLSHIPYYCVITQYSLTKINGGDRSGMFLAVCYHIFLITMLLHSTVCVITQYILTKINGGDRSGMFLAVCYHLFLITVLLHNTV